jgi:hypothetical protein
MNIYTEYLVSILGRSWGRGGEQPVRSVNPMIGRAFRIQRKTRRHTCYNLVYEIPYGQTEES